MPDTLNTIKRVASTVGSNLHKMIVGVTDFAEREEKV
jgi:hypothetical protein